MGNEFSLNAPNTESLLSASPIATSSRVTRPTINIERLEPVKLAIVTSSDDSCITQDEKLLSNLHAVSTDVNCFHNSRSFKEWSKSRSTDEKILLVVSYKLAKQVISDVHDSAFIHRIYILSSTLTDDLSWIGNYSKICSIIYSNDGLLYQILNDQIIYNKTFASEDFHMFRNRPHTVVVNVENDSFVCFISFIKVLIEPSFLPSLPSSQPFLEYLRRYYSTNPKILKFIKQLEDNYKEDGPIKTLLNNEPLARFLDKALREQDISLLFYFRFLLHDIYKYLSDYSLPSVDAYITWTMSSNDINEFRQNVNNYMMCKSFLLTSTNSSIVSSIDVKNTQDQNVLIKIHAERQVDTFTFACVETNHIPGEKTETMSKILFMPGSIFIIKSFSRITSSTWILELILVGHNEIKILSGVQRKIQANNGLLYILELFEKYEQQKKANDFRQHLLHELPPDHSLFPMINENEPTCLNRNNIIVIKSKLSFDRTAAKMLDRFYSMSNGSITIYENLSDIRFDQIFNGKFIIFFAHVEIIRAIQRKRLNQSNVQYITLNDNPHAEQQGGTVAYTIDLMFQLGDDLARLFKNESDDDSKMGKQSLAQAKQQIADQFEPEMKKILREYSTNDIHNQPPICTETNVICCVTNQINENVIIEKRDTFHEVITQFLIFYDQSDIETHILTNNFDAHSFIIVESDDPSSLTTLKQFKNIKKKYCIGRSLSIEEIFSDLTLKLIDHYNELASQFDDRNDSTNANDMRRKARDLAQLLPETLNK